MRSPYHAIARNPNHLDLFVTGTDGRIYSTWWDASGGWANWFNVSGGAAALGSPITVVARNPNHLDLFVTGTDGGIYSSLVGCERRLGHWFNVSGGRAALGSKVTAIARNPNHLDLFVTGTDGRIYSCWWDQSGGWAAGSTSPAARRRWARRSPRSHAIRTISICSLPAPTAASIPRWWDQSGGWAAWFNVSGGAAALRSPITAVARNPNHLDLFVTGTDGRIYSSWWDQSGGWAAWFNVSGGAAALASEITAIARNPNHLDLFVTGTDGRIYSTWWDASGGWANWFNVSGGAAALTSPITPIARFPTISTCSSPAPMAASIPPGGTSPRQLRVHVKVLSEPTTVARAQMIQSMRDVYAGVGIDVVIASEETLNLPALNDLDVGTCVMGSTTAEQNTVVRQPQQCRRATTSASTSSARRCRR